MSKPLNPQQASAVSDFGVDLLVTAGAGTGKTTVLTGKYLRLLEERRATIREIVAITFTKKAAAEMRERIRMEIRDRIDKAADAAYWEESLLELESARIGTFHSFCLGLIREHPLETGITPVTGILSEGETALFINEAIENLITGYLKAPDVHERDKQILLRMLLDFGWEGFQTALGAIYRTLRESGIPFDEVIRQSRDGLRTACAGCPYSIDQLISEIEALLDFCRTAPLTERAEKIIASLRNDWPVYRVSLTTDDRVDELLPALAELAKALPKNLPGTIKGLVVRIRDMIDVICRRLVEEEILERLPVFEKMLTGLDRIYTRTKHELGYLDFSDQLILARDLLRTVPYVAAAVRAGIKYLLVDEFQDTNSLQMELIKILLGEGYPDGRLMVVGDIKQSIYRFRGAQADLMLQLAADLEARQGRSIPLTQNYRSAPLVIRFVNAISGSLFANEPFPYEPLEAARTDTQTGHVEFILSGDPAGRISEARMIARRIVQLVLAEADPDTGEPVTYGDIAILFRVGTAIPVYQKALQELGIPYYTASGGGFYRCPEVRDQLNLLRIMLNRYDAVALLGLLTSPYAGVSDESLLWLAGDGDLAFAFYNREHFAPEINPDERQRLFRLRELLNLLHQQREYLSISEVLRLALDYCHYRETLWAFPDAGQRLANLEKLLVKADEFTAKGFHDPGRFLTFIAELETVEVIEGEAPIQMETGNVVRLMTIHRAKGLEFPIVFLPDLDRCFKRGTGGRIIYHKAIGLGFGVKYGENETGYGTNWEAIKRLNQQEELAELKRILYVALTRAKSRLILAGSGCSKSKATEIGNADNWMKWFELLLPLTGAGPVLDFEGIPIRIIRELPEPEKNSRRTGLDDSNISGFLEAIEAVEPETAASTEPDTEPEAGGAVFIPEKFKITLKVIQLPVFKRCPRRYFLKYRLRLEEDFDQETDFTVDTFQDDGGESGRDLGIRRGNFIHKLFQLQSPDWPEELWTAAFDDLPAEIAQKLKADVLRMWHNFQNSPFNKNYSQIWDEVQFTLKLSENIFIEGRFDRLIKDGAGKLILVDYKTDTAGEAEVKNIAAGYFRQLQLYALAVEALWGRLPDQAVLYFVHRDQEVTVPLQRELLDRTKAEVIEMANFVGTHFRGEDYPTGKECKGCGYLKYCFG